jgi:hypothetical protein
MVRDPWTLAFAATLYEDQHFTPWLSQPENLALLAETLGLGELRLEGTEIPVGSFALDLLARDMTGGIVLIEHQFGPTDHSHLGQLMTYLAGQKDRGTVIWIAERFKEEHRAAIDWLNSNTVESYNFFGVEIEVLSINGSVPAPWFNVISKPNEWGLLRPGTREYSGVLEPNCDGEDSWWVSRPGVSDHGPPPSQPTRPWPKPGHSRSRGLTATISTGSRGDPSRRAATSWWPEPPTARSETLRRPPST